MKPRFFRSPADWRAWLEEHHLSETELHVGFHKKLTGRPSLTWSESVDQALCFGWIDGVRRRVDDDRYTIRFTPRKPTSAWSHVNIAKVAALQAAGLMHPAGLAAFEARLGGRSRIYSYEQRHEAELAPADLATFRASATAWRYFASQPAGYRHTATFWVVSAKKEETRQRRLAQLIVDSAAGRRIALLERKP